MNITPEFLHSISPGASPAMVAAIIANQGLLVRYKITDPKHIAYFFGQCACETAGFTSITENLYYTSTTRLQQVWPTRFTTDVAALPYVRQPQKLANYVYGGRLGNRGPNDGWDYRGSGLKQNTGASNFATVQSTSGLDCLAHPELLRAFPGAFESACVFWVANHLSKFADAGDIVGLTKAVTGAASGLADRRVYTDRALQAIAHGSVPLHPGSASWLRNGSLGPYVVNLEKALQAKGYYVGGKIDGVFGEGVENAVRHFQADHGLTVDGVVGDATAAALNAPATPTPAPAIPAAPAPVQPVPMPVPVSEAPQPQTPVETPSPVPQTATGIGALLLALIKAILAIFRRG